MLTTGFVMLIVLLGIKALDHFEITQGAAGSVSPILAVPIVMLLAVGTWRFMERHHLIKHQDAHR